MNEDIVQWINNNLQYSRGLIGKKCKREWFEKYGTMDKWNQIHEKTSFLDHSNPTFPQRIWHIIKHQYLPIKCSNPSCSESPKFWSFNVGYLRACSPSCAQLDPETQEKIKNTNYKKYGTKYGLQNRDVINKRQRTLNNKYGVTNISHADGISNKKRETCFKNYGTTWFLERTDLIKKYVEDKYGVENVQQNKEISQKASRTKMNKFYDLLLISDRFGGRVVPLFSKEEYHGTCEEYKFECSICHTTFNYDLRWGRIPRCPICYKGSSVFEKEITDYIKSLLTPDVVVEENTKSVLPGNKELDIYIPSKNLAVECDGLFWHGEFGGGKNKTYHLSKTDECEAKGIRLIHIFEDEWILNKNIVENRLAHMIGVNKDKSIYARDCEIKEITTEDKNLFLENNHIQGSDKSKIKLGLYYEAELIAVMTFDKYRIFMNCRSTNNEYELIRYSTSKNVAGGASKLLSYFIKTYNPKKIVSYADRRWSYSKNNLYERMGFKKISYGTPNYWYFGRDGNYRRFHRFGFAKHTLPRKLAIFDPNLSEWENMKNNGWDRIWDCGSLKYEMVF